MDDLMDHVDLLMKAFDAMTDGHLLLSGNALPARHEVAPPHGEALACSGSGSGNLQNKSQFQCQGQGQGQGLAVREPCAAWT